MKNIKRLLWRIGHRGAFLLFLSLLDLLYGFSLLSSARAAQHVDLTLGWNVWGYIWIAVGVVLLIGAFTKEDRIPYAVAATIKAAWATVWVKIWLFSHPHVPLSWVSAVIWGAFSAIVVIVSTWPESRRHRRVKTIENCVDVPVIESDGNLNEDHPE